MKIITKKNSENPGKTWTIDHMQGDTSERYLEVMIEALETETFSKQSIIDSMHEWLEENDPAYVERAPKCCDRDHDHDGNCDIHPPYGHTFAVDFESLDEDDSLKEMIHHIRNSPEVPRALLIKDILTGSPLPLSFIQTNEVDGISQTNEIKFGIDWDATWGTEEKPHFELDMDKVNPELLDENQSLREDLDVAQVNITELHDELQRTRDRNGALKRANADLVNQRNEAAEFSHLYRNDRDNMFSLNEKLKEELQILRHQFNGVCSGKINVELDLENAQRELEIERRKNDACEASNESLMYWYRIVHPRMVEAERKLEKLKKPLSQLDGHSIAFPRENKMFPLSFPNEFTISYNRESTAWVLRRDDTWPLFTYSSTSLISMLATLRDLCE